MSIDAPQPVPLRLRFVLRARRDERFGVRAVGIAALALLIPLVGAPAALAHGGGAHGGDKSTTSNEVKSRSNHVRLPGANLNRESSSTEASGGGEAGAGHPMHMRLPHDTDFIGPSSNHSVGAYRGGSEPPAAKPVGSNENGAAHTGSGAAPGARPAGAGARGGA